MDDVIFEPLQFRNLAVKNRIFRSNISGRFDNYDRSGSRPRLFAALLERSGSGGAAAHCCWAQPVYDHQRPGGAGSRSHVAQLTVLL